MTTSLLAIGATVVVLLALAFLTLLVVLIGLLHNATAELARQRAALDRVGIALVSLQAHVTRLATVLSGPLRIEFPAAPPATPPQLDRIPTAGGTH